MNAWRYDSASAVVKTCRLDGAASVFVFEEGSSGAEAVEGYGSSVGMVDGPWGCFG